MTPQELLIVLIHEILDHEQASNVVEQGVLHRWVELHRVWILPIVPNRMVHLDHGLLTFGSLRLIHRSHVTWCFIPLLVAEDARLKMLLSLLHF